MASEVPLSYMLDAGGVLTRSLQTDPLREIIDAQGAFSNTAFDRLTNEALELLLPQPDVVTDIYKRYAFLSSALIVAAAFERSDACEVDRARVERRLAIHSVPRELVGDGPSQTLTGFQVVAKQAYDRHREIRNATGILIGFHQGATKEAITSRYAFCGVGFMINQLDAAWTRIIAAKSSEAFNAENAHITNEDWETFFR